MYVLHRFLLKTYPTKIDATFNYISQKKINNDMRFNESNLSITLIDHGNELTKIYCSTLELIDYKNQPHLLEAIKDPKTIIEYDNLTIDINELFRLIEDRKTHKDYYHYKIQHDIALRDAFTKE